MPRYFRQGGLVMAASASVALLGAGGTMGLEMARNLARAGMDVRGWNRSGDKATPLAADGGQAIAERRFEPSFRLALAAKDAALVQEAAERQGMDLPLIRTVQARLSQSAQDHGEKDMSATYLTSAVRTPQ